MRRRDDSPETYGFDVVTGFKTVGSRSNAPAGPKWKVEEAERYEWGKRVREVEQDSMGNIYVLEDKEGGRLIKLSE